MVQSSISYWQQNDSNNVNNINYLPEHIKIALVDWWGARTVVLHLEKKKILLSINYINTYISDAHIMRSSWHFKASATPCKPALDQFTQPLKIQI